MDDYFFRYGRRIGGRRFRARFHLKYCFHLTGQLLRCQYLLYLDTQPVHFRVFFLEQCLQDKRSDDNFYRVLLPSFENFGTIIQQSNPVVLFYLLQLFQDGYCQRI